MTQILSIIVLYRLKAEESVAFQRFHDALQQAPELRSVYRLDIFDNSPEAQQPASDYVSKYVHDSSNPGLAKPYNVALEQAQAAGIPWLMILDQDTSVTLAYLREAARLSEQKAAVHEVFALVPKLLQDGAVSSPHTLLSLRNTKPVPHNMVGLAKEELHAFNSGSIMRVAALLTVGGFPLHYPLDFLDHATFRILQRQRSTQRMFLMESCLEHDLSLETIMRSRARDVPARLHQVFSTEARFYREMGDPSERILRRLRLLFFALENFSKGSLGRARLFLRLAFRLR